MSRSQRSTSQRDDVALRRLTALAGNLAAAPPSPVSGRSGAASEQVSEPEPSVDPPLVGSIPAPPYARHPDQDAAHSASARTTSGGAARGEAPPADTAQPSADAAQPEPPPRHAPPPVAYRDGTPSGSGDDRGGAPGPDPPMRPPPGYVEVGDHLTRRSWRTVLRDRLPASLTDHPHLSRTGLHAIVAVCSVAVIAASWFLIQARPTPEPTPEPAPEPGSPSGEPVAGSAPSGAEPASAGQSPGAAPQPTGEVMVHVDGEVGEPGVVTLPAGSRVADAVEAAGGVDSGTDTDSLNLARPVVDGEQILVGVTPPPGAAEPGAGAPAGTPGGQEPLIDLNAASPEQLEELPGVGPVLAERIVEYRTSNGGFTSVEQLNDVSGIGEVRYAELSELVQVSGAG